MCPVYTEDTIPWAPGHLGSQGRQHLTGLAPGEVPAAGEKGKSIPAHGKQLRAGEAASALPVPAGDIRERGDGAWALAELPATPDVICLERPGWAGAASRWEKGFTPRSRTGALLGRECGCQAADSSPAPLQLLKSSSFPSLSMVRAQPAPGAPSLTARSTPSLGWV